MLARLLTVVNAPPLIPVAVAAVVALPALVALVAVAALPVVLLVNVPKIFVPFSGWLAIWPLAMLVTTVNAPPLIPVAVAAVVALPAVVALVAVAALPVVLLVNVPKTFVPFSGLLAICPLAMFVTTVKAPPLIPVAVVALPALVAVAALPVVLLVNVPKIFVPFSGWLAI